MRRSHTPKVRRPEEPRVARSAVEGDAGRSPPGDDPGLLGVHRGPRSASGSRIGSTDRRRNDAQTMRGRLIACVLLIAGCGAADPRGRPVDDGCAPGGDDNAGTCDEPPAPAAAATLPAYRFTMSLSVVPDGGQARLVETARRRGHRRLRCDAALRPGRRLAHRRRHRRHVVVGPRGAGPPARRAGGSGLPRPERPAPTGETSPGCSQTPGRGTTSAPSRISASRPSS